MEYFSTLCNKIKSSISTLCIKKFDLNLLTLESGENSNVPNFEESDEILVKASQDPETKQPNSQNFDAFSDVRLWNLTENTIPVNKAKMVKLRPNQRTLKKNSKCVTFWTKLTHFFKLLKVRYIGTSSFFSIETLNAL